MRQISVMLMALVVLLSGACFVSITQVFPPAQAEDMGDVFSYRTFIVTDWDHPIKTVFKREVGNRYYAVVELQEGYEPGPERNFGISEFRRFGLRGDEPIYIIQTVPAGVSSGEGYVISLVALRADGLGVLALLDCEDPKVTALAARYGVTATCDDSNSYLPIFRGSYDGAALLAFLEQAAAEDLFLWEDTANYSVFEQIASGI